MDFLFGVDRACFKISVFLFLVCQPDWVLVSFFYFLGGSC